VNAKPPANAKWDVCRVDTLECRRVLGIGAEQPLADWYDVLRVPRFERDERVLEQAVARQIDQARRYEVGKYQEAALVLLEELTKVFLWLTDAEERSQYDAVLKSAGGDAGPREVAVLRPAAPGAAVPRPTPSRRPPPAASAPTEPVPADAPGAQHTPPPSPLSPDRPPCPKCGRPLSTKSRRCLHCGHRQSPLEPEPATMSGGRPAAVRGLDATGTAATLLPRGVNLSVDQILQRLRETKRLARANTLGARHWTNPALHPLAQGGHCYLCHSLLPSRQSVYGIEHLELCQTGLYLAAAARKLQSVKGQHYPCPLSPADARRVYEALPQTPADRVRLLCERCFKRVQDSPRLIT
jgi:hypothetical protein